MNKLATLYREVISSLGWTVTEEGKIALRIGDDSTEIVEDGMYWVFPDTQYRPPNEPWLLFHPALDQGQAAIIERMRARMQTLIVTRTLYVILNMVMFATSDINQERITSKQSDLLRVLEDADVNTCTHLTRLVNEIHTRSSGTGAKQNELKYSFMTLYIKSGGRIGSKTYAKVVALSSKLYELMLNPKGDALFEGNKVLGVKLRKADVALLKKVMGWVFPKIEAPGEDSFWVMGGKTDHGTSFYTLVEVYTRVMDRLKSIADTIAMKDGDGIHQKMHYDLREMLDASLSDPGSFSKIPSRLAMEGRVTSNLEAKQPYRGIASKVSPTMPSQAKQADAATSPPPKGKMSYSDYLASQGRTPSSQVTAGPGRATGSVGGARLMTLANGKVVVVNGNDEVIEGLGQGGAAQVQQPQQVQRPAYTGPKAVGEAILDTSDGRHYFKMEDGTWQPAVLYQGRMVPEGILRAMQQPSQQGPRANATGGNYSQPAPQPYQQQNQQPQPARDGYGGRMRSVR
jgi:hypothetical protein